MNFLQAIVLSIVEGITEFLPISSTGHLILASNLLHISQTDFVKSFEIFIQLGAILAVVVLYWRDFLNVKLWPQIIAGFLPTAVLGLVFYKTVKDVLLGNVTITLAALFLGGIILILLDKIPRLKSRKIDLKTAAWIGLGQSVSMIPGVSRSAATIVTAILLGVNKDEAIKYSFLLAVPTMAAATGLDLIKSHLKFSGSEFLLLAVGFIGAFGTAILAIKFFLNYLRQHSFRDFGIYRVVFSVAYFFLGR